MGGATTGPGAQRNLYQGLSPRGRGNLMPELIWENSNGSIPAWAGQPTLVSSPVSLYWVYPRVGGATSTSERTASPRTGLSPRGRGNLHPSPCKNGWTRSIPAWAGQPHWKSNPACAASVYPRVGGATPISRILAGANHLPG